MTLARANRFTQTELFTLRPSFLIKSNAEARNRYGAAAQELVCQALGLSPIPIDGRHKVNFDAELDGSFYEIKSVRRGHKIVLYDFRMKKESDAGVPLTYAIFVHSVTLARSSETMWGGFQDHSIVVIPATVIHELAAEEPLRFLGSATVEANKDNPRFGYARAGYAEGYRNLPVGKVLERVKLSRAVEFRRYDWTFKASIYEP